MDLGPPGNEGHSTLSLFSCVEPEAKVGIGSRGTWCISVLRLL